jgi:hypothetical protein
LPTKFPNRTASEIAGQVAGIDIHPLSVQIAKTTVVLALGDLVRAANSPVILHIYLANSLLVPHESADLFKTNFRIAIDNKPYMLDVSGLDGPGFDQLISICDDVVHHYVEPISPEEFSEIALRQTKSTGPVISQLYDIYRGMKAAKDADRDSIWKFIIQNSYKPVFLRGRFDLIVGNPPWLTYSAFKNQEYQELVKTISDDYGVSPSNKASLPHLEIAAVFLAHSVNYFLSDTGVLAFVLPRSFMTADHHEPTRRGVVRGMQIRSVWDLRSVSPLFRVPCCVLVATHAPADGEHPIPDSGVAGLEISGRLPRAHMHLGSGLIARRAR